jgi:hypothetical protein
MDATPKSESLDEGCIQCLNYFNIFKYPLTAEEIYQFNSVRASIAEVESTLERLVDLHRIHAIERFYLLEDNAAWVEERKKGNQRADTLLSRSPKYSSVIASFPFVRAIAISGSLSKHYASKHPDIDYFIITEANRLWIARTLLHLFKKLTFITGHQHYYCMNYFVDTKALKLSHQNQYSAIEIATLLPAYEFRLVKQFSDSNQWIKLYLPNHPGINNKAFLIRKRKRYLKQTFEGIFNLLMPERINKYLMHLTDRKWRSKWSRGGYDMEVYDRAFLTNIHVSKNHPEDYEKMVLENLEKTSIE